MDETATTPTTPPGAVAPQERIRCLDVLRGVGVLGILVMNIQLMAMPGAAYENPTAYGDMHGANYWVWYAGALLADSKFMAIFSMLFGAGILLMAGRQEEAGRRPAAFHYRRMGVLLAFGLAHGYLLWPGDILYSYALCGMAIYPLRRLSPKWLMAVGVLVLAIGSGISFYLYHDHVSARPDKQEEARHEYTPPPEAVAEELAMYRAGWWDICRNRWPITFYIETAEFGGYIAWRAAGMMLVGMALYKLGVLTGRRGPGFYRLLATAGLLVGLPAVAYGIRQAFAHDWEVGRARYLDSQYNYWGAIPVSLGYVGLVMLACQDPALRRVTSPFAAVGRLAFTNYLMQTVICTTIFYGYGFGLFGKVERLGQFGVVVAVWVVQLLLSPLWLLFFRMGPAEWLWRTLTYGRLQPLLACPVQGLPATGR